MSRLAAKEKLLYYPTPLRIIDLIASNIDRQHIDSYSTIIDPCAGDGAAVGRLAAHLGLNPDHIYGIELDPHRAALASRRFQCLTGPREFAQVEGEFHIVFNNPPYDQAFETGRMELNHMRHDLDLLAGDGLAIWIIPESIFNDDLYQLLAKYTYAADVRLRRFPQPEYQAFKQVVVFARKRFGESLYTFHDVDQLRAQAADIPTLTEAELELRFTYYYAKPVTSFNLSLPDGGQILAEVETHGLHHTDTWQSLFGATSAGFGQFQPLMPLSGGHTAWVIAAGLVDGTEVIIDGQQHIIKGSTVKEITVTREETADQVTERHRERLAQTVSALNLATGELTEYNSLHQPQDFKAFLLQHQELLIRTIKANYPPHFNPNSDLEPWQPALDRVHAPGPLPGEDRENGLLPAQQVRAAALAQQLQTEKSVVLIGEMGTGKTCCSQAIAALIGRGNWKLVVVCPAQVTEKWKREAEKVLRDFGVRCHIIGQKRKQAHQELPRYDKPLQLTQRNNHPWLVKRGKPVLDVQRAMEEPNPSILIMSYQTAKNAPRWKHAPAIQRKAIEVKELILDRFGRHVETTVTKMKTVLCCPDCGAIIRNNRGAPLTAPKQMGKKKHRCSCGAALWQQIPFAYGGRTAIADYLNRHYAGRYNLILDEAHYGKGADTDTGYAVTDLVVGARKVIAMTGTIYAGKASSIFHLLYRLFANFRELYGYNEVKRFVEHHGLQEEIIKTKKDSGGGHTSTYGYERDDTRRRFKELPGVTPGIVTQLLPNTAFLKLEDMGLQMPPYVEERLPVPLDDCLQDGLEQLADIYQDATQLASKGQPALLSAWLYASLGWMDCPVQEDIAVHNENGILAAHYTIDGVLDHRDEIPDPPLAKDLALLDLIEAELSHGRGVGAYFAQVNKRDWMTRIQKQLQQRGIYSEVLRQATAKPEDRENWYRQFVKRCRKRGQEPVLLANGNLVKEGLDLVELPTLVEAGIEYRLNDLRQRDRRSWRLIQDRPVRVVFLYYEGTWQETALQLMAAKLKAATMVDGDLAEGLAAMELDDTDLVDALMRTIASKNGVGWNGTMPLAEFSKAEAPPPPPEPEPTGDDTQPHFGHIQVDIQAEGDVVQMTFF